MNRGRTRLASVPIVGDSDDALVETPCKGVDWRLQLPAINTDECQTWIQVQNVGNQDTQALLVLWGAPSFCPPQAAGPLKVECTGLLRPGSAWTLTNPFLPVIAGLPGNWIGSARIESQNWLSPGDPAISSPRILSVVMLEKYTDPAKAARQETVLYNALQEMGSYDWQLGPGRGGFRGTDVLSIPLAAKRNRGVSTELAIQNLNPHPGFTDFVIFVYDQNRLIDFVCEKLNEKQVEYINLDEWGVIPPGFLGSLVISATYTNQRGGDPSQEGVGVALGAVAVERVGRVLSEPDIPGDESKAFEAFPLFDGGFRVEVGPDGQPPACPGQP